jgi:threonine dehydratase
VDVKYTLSDLRIISASPEEVKVSFVQRSEKVGGKGQFIDNIVEGIHTMRPNQGTWKIYKTLQTKVTDLRGKPLLEPEPPAVSPAATPAPQPPEPVAPASGTPK